MHLLVCLLSLRDSISLKCHTASAGPAYIDAETNVNRCAIPVATVVDASVAIGVGCPASAGPAIDAETRSAIRCHTTAVAVIRCIATAAAKGGLLLLQSRIIMSSFGWNRLLYRPNSTFQMARSIILSIVLGKQPYNDQLEAEVFVLTRLDYFQ